MFILPNFSFAQIKRTPIIKYRPGLEPTRIPLDPCLVEVQAIPNLSSGENTGSLNLRSSAPNDKDKVLKTNEEAKPWIHFDLGSVQKLKKVRFKPEIAANQQKSYFLLYSSDMPLDQSLSSVSYRSESVTLNGTDFIELNNIEARYIKIQLIEDIPQSLALSGVQFLAACGPTPTPEDGKCDNGGFERGDFTGWTAQVGKAVTRGGQNQMENITNGFDPSRFAIETTPLYDGYIGYGNPCTGKYVARLGAKGVGLWGVERLTYSFNVDNDNKNFYFRYAMVLQDGGHAKDEQPYFQYRFYYLENGKQKEIRNVKIIADANNPFFKGGFHLAKSWTCENIDLSSFIGVTVFAEFTNSDCSEGGHATYSYIDGLCTSPQDNAPKGAISGAGIVCNDQDFKYSGVSSCGANQYTWKLGKLHFKGFVQNEVAQNFFGQPGDVNIGELYKNNGQNFEFGNTYRLTLIVRNDCGLESTTYKDIFINERNRVDYKDIIICGSYTGDIKMQQNYNTCSNCSYQWSSSWKFDNPTSFAPILKSQYALCGTTVKVYTTDPNGCVSTDEIKIYPLTPNFISINKDVDKSALPRSQYCNYSVDVKLATECLPTEYLKLKLTTDADPNYEKIGDLTSSVSNAYNYNFKIPQSLGENLVNSSNRVKINLFFDNNFVHVYGDYCLSHITTLENRFWYWGYFNTQNKYVKGFLPVNTQERYLDNARDGIANEPGIFFPDRFSPTAQTVTNQTFTSFSKKDYGFGVFWRKIEIFAPQGQLVQRLEETALPPTITLNNRFADNWRMWRGEYDNTTDLKYYDPANFTWYINMENCSSGRMTTIPDNWYWSAIIKLLN
jgi:hypothetical protein